MPVGSSNPTLLRRKSIEGGYAELVALDASWEPWTYQVNRYVYNGKAYNRPGQLTLVGMSNYRTLDAAKAGFDTQ